MTHANNVGIYLFCFAQSGMQSLLEETGFDACRPVRIEKCSSVAAVVSEVPLDDFCGPAAEKNLSDLAWLSPLACRHEKVIERAMQYSPVLPAGFGTIFSSLTQLNRYVQQHAQAISEFLERIAGQEEWSVKGVLNRSAGQRDTLKGLPLDRQEDLASLPPGTRYLREQKLRIDVDKARHARLMEICRGLEASLKKSTSGFCNRKVLIKSPAGEGMEVILNWAFLVEKSKVPDFRMEIETANRAHADTGLGFGLTGPWPPFSFSPSFSVNDSGL